MPQALPELTKLHDFIMLCQLKGITRCRKDTGMGHLKDGNTESLLPKKKMVSTKHGFSCLCHLPFLFAFELTQQIFEHSND